MPRNVKESDDEVETKGGRRMRVVLNSSILDSPLRRSSRIKPPASQDVSSPESVGDATSVSGPKNTRRRTAVGEAVIPEPVRITRGRRNSTASDISELTETESLPDGPPRRITRRSIAGLPLPDTPTTLNSRTRRASRAGSETKSTPPVAKPVRRTRASSMEPETIDETKVRQIGTPVKSRKRALVMPSEPALAEESEDGRNTNVAKNVEKTVYEMEEDVFESVSHNTSASMRQNSKVDVNESDEKMEVDESPVKETDDDTAERSAREFTEQLTDISGISRKLDYSMKITDSHDDNVAPDDALELEKRSSPSKDSPHTIETIVNKSTEKQDTIETIVNKSTEKQDTIETIVNKSTEKQDKSPGNKENEIFNCSDVSIDRCVKLSDNEAQLFHKKAFKSTLAKIAENRRYHSSDDKNQLAETMVRKGHLVDECIVVIEPMVINIEKGIVAQASVVPKPKVQDDGAPELDSNPPLTEQRKQGVAPETENTEIKEASTNNENIVDGESDLQISNVVSMAVEEEPTKKNDQPFVETDAEAIKINAPDETIDFESSVGENEETCKKLSIIDTKPIDSQFSLINENLKTNEETEDIVLDMVKGKSSIVTESPVSGTNAAEATDSIEEKNNDESVANGGPPAPIVDKVVENDEPESLKMKNAAEPKVVESDSEYSEYSGCPAFKDITADEWTGANAEAIQKNTSDEANSVHSASTERNESECEIELVDKEAPPIVENSQYKREEKSDYDTDDTVITHNNPASEETEEKRNDENTVVDDVTPMDLSSDPDEDGDLTSKSSKESSNKRSSLATPRKSIGTNSPLKDKNVSITCSMDVESTSTDSPTKDLADISLKSKMSVSKSPKKRSSFAASQPTDDASSDSDEDTEKSEAKTTKTAQTPDRRSFDALAKKLDTSRSNVSAKNTPSKIETEARETSAKRRSSNRFTHIINNDDSEDELDNAEDENKSQSSSKSSTKIATKLTPMKQGKSRLSGIKVIDDNSSSTLTEDTRSSPLIVEEQHDVSVKTGSARKSISNRSSSKITDSNSDSEIDENDDEDSLAKTNESSKSERASVNKNDSRGTRDSSDSDSEVDGAKDDSASSKIVEENFDGSTEQESVGKFAIHQETLNGSSKQGSARKSAFNEEILNRSSKQGSARKSINNEEILNRSSKQGSARKSINNEEILNRSSKQGSARKSINNEEILNRSSKQGSARKSTNNVEILNRSSKQESARKSTIDRNNSRTEPVSSDSETEVGDSKKSPDTMKIASRASKSSLIDTDSESDESDKQLKVPRLKTGSGIKLAFDVDNDYSTIAQVNSDSEIIDSSSSDEDASSIIPNFFFDQDSTSSSSSSNSSIENDDSSDTIDSDVARDLNLHGKSILEYSDDDVPADDCMATESESSDSDDDGADLMDFVVDDEEDDSFEDVAMDLGAGENNDSSGGDEKKKPRRRIITRPGGDSDSDESDEENDLINESANAKTPKRDKIPNKSDVAEPEVQSGDLSVSSRAAAKRNKNILIESSTPRVRNGDRPEFDKDNSSKAATPLSNANLNSSKSSKTADSSTKMVINETPLSKKLSKSVCETEDTPTKLSSSFKITKSLKSPGMATLCLQTSPPTDFRAPLRETLFSKMKSPNVPAHHQTMTTPNSESPETRFLMKEKLNDSLPALKLQQRVKVSRRSTLDNLREVLSEKQSKDADEVNAAANSEAVSVEPEVVVTEKKKKKKKKAAKNTSTDSDSKSLGTSMETEGAAIDNKSNECLGEDSSRDISKKRDKKKKKMAEMPAEESVEFKNENVSTKDKKRKPMKKLEDNVVEVPVREPSKKDEKKKKKQQQQLDGTADEVETIETSKKDKKKKKKREETVDEVETIEINKKDKKKKKSEEMVIEEPIKKDKKRKHEKAMEAADAPATKKKSMRAAENSVGKRSSGLDNVTEVRAVQDAKLNRQRRIEDRLVAPNAVVTSKTTLKRLSDEILESLTDAPERPTKRRKIAKQEKIVPSRTMFDGSREPTENIKIDEGYIPLSVSGGTTQFAVVNLQKMTKKSKRSAVAGSFRERMLARNPRQPISAYLMYQQKQKASGKDRPY